MCGIAGAIGLSAERRPDPERVRTMSRHIAHRGPDGEGIWISPSGRACFAHRRLAVIDLASGHQPMISDHGAAGLVFNGEIYNYLELKRDLAKDGTTFQTTSDTEVLLRLATTLGPECIQQLRGMFAFAYWHDETGQLLLARDRIGKKPLYYCVTDGCLYFASTLNALRSGSGVAEKIDLQSLDQYLNFGYVPAPNTIYQSIFKLPAATLAVLSDDELSIRRYWDTKERRVFEGTYDEALDELDELIGESIKIRLRSDVPLGVFLSGGVDSSLVASLAAKYTSTRLSTFTVGFDESSYDESAHAALVAQHLGTKHHQIQAKPDLMNLVPEIVDHFGEPYADSSALPTWVLSQSTRPHVTVALGGDGGDEGFAGYNWYQTALRVSAIRSKIPSRILQGGAMCSTLLHDIVPGSKFAGRLSRGMSLLGVRSEARRFAALRTFMNSRERTILYGKELLDMRRESRGAPSTIEDAFNRCAGSELRKMRYSDMETYLADDLMPKVDVASMAHGLEIRAPLLDQQVIEFGMSLPDDYLINAQGGKRILKDLAGRYVPASVLNRPKSGFSLPLSRWLNGPLRKQAESLIRSDELCSLGLRSEGIRAIVKEHQGGIRDHSDRLFSLMVLKQWRQDGGLSLGSV